MPEIETTITRIARTRVRDALLRLPFDGPRVVSLSAVAAHADVTRTVAETCMTELEADGPFFVTRLGCADELRWRVK